MEKCVTPTYPARNGRRLKQRRGPGPLRDDGCRRQPDAHLTARVEGGVQIIGVVINVTSNLKASQ